MFSAARRPTASPTDADQPYLGQTFRIGGIVALTLIVLMACPGVALACPYCDSNIGRQVSAGIFNDDFWLNGLLTLLPVPVLLGIVALIHFGLPRPSRGAAPVPVIQRRRAASASKRRADQ